MRSVASLLALCVGRQAPLHRLGALALALTIGCEAAEGSGTPRPDISPEQAAASALYRLSRREVESTLSDVLGIAGLAEKYLPPDLLSPFDTDVRSKEASHVFVQGLERLATEVGLRVAADPQRLVSLAGCSPGSPDDAACFEALARRLALRLWRRPLEESELTPMLARALPFARERNDVSLAVRVLVSSLLQSPAFIYRSEVGSMTGPLRKLDNFELVSKLSYWLWGSAPGALLLERAAGSELSTEELGEVASRMLKDPRADAQLLTFHRQWLEFENLRVPPELAPSMLQETRALIQKVLVDERGPWSRLLTSPVTFVDSRLSEHYGLPAPTEPAGSWVTYTRPEQVGILAHGSLLSLAGRHTDDTSPTLRGKYFATHLMCWTIPPPPPNVNPDLPPAGSLSECKTEAYRLHRDRSTPCSSCHLLMDPIGFGLERLDAFGRYRTEEKNKTGCPISGDGELLGVGKFNGLKGLFDLALANHHVQSCAVKQYLRFTRGRNEQPDDDAVLGRLTGAFLESGEDFRALVLAAVTDPSFRYRREEP